MKTSLTCYGGVGTVTGANFLLEIESSGKTLRILIDCGLFQGLVGDEGVTKTFDYDVTNIDHLFITHAHIDHIGRIPDLIKAGFRGEILSTRETKDIARFMLKDLSHIAGEGEDAAEKALSMWEIHPYHTKRKFDLGGEEAFSLELFDAGHILGSAMYKLTFPSGKSILFSGDIGNSPAPLQSDVERVTDATYILMDSVYGDRNHESIESRDKRFAEIIHDVIERKSTLLIPVFSLERTQVMIHELDKLFTMKGLKSIPVFLDSPLAINITEIYRDRFNSKDKDLYFNKLQETAQVRDSISISHVPGPKIIMAGSGMSTAGRIVHHEERYLPDPNATILFVGYQAAGTLGRLIQDGVKEVTINDKNIKVNARVLSIGGFSAHADSDQLVKFVETSEKSVKQVFITMGEPKSSIFLAQRLKDELGVDSVIPEKGKRYELDL